MGVELEIKTCNQGVHVGQRLSLGMYGKGFQGNAVVANRTREIRPSGMKGGLRETWIVGNPIIARTRILPDRLKELLSF